MNTLCCPCCRLVLEERTLAVEYCPRCIARRRSAIRLIPDTDDIRVPVHSHSDREPHGKRRQAGKRLPGGT